MILLAFLLLFSITCIYAGFLTFSQDPSIAAALALAGVVLLLKPLTFIYNHFKKPPAVRPGVVDLQKYRAKGRRKPPREKPEKREKPPTYH